MYRDYIGKKNLKTKYWFRFCIRLQKVNLANPVVWFFPIITTKMFLRHLKKDSSEIQMTLWKDLFIHFYLPTKIFKFQEIIPNYEQKRR